MRTGTHLSRGTNPSRYSEPKRRTFNASHDNDEFAEHEPDAEASEPGDEELHEASRLHTDSLEAVQGDSWHNPACSD